jgi:tRNA nucleotidyltransferase (CCA-adding enzyme)
MDFDSLAAQFGVTKLNPSARMILGFPLTGNVRDFVTLYRSSMPISQIKYIDLSRVTKVFIVDCQHLERLDETAKALIAPEGRNLPFTIYDHHDPAPEGLGCRAQPDSIIEKVGAATSIVVDEICKRQIALTPFEATILAIGIYEDTGCLTYGGTTAKDGRCLAFLLQSGADLAIINDFIHAKMNDEQTELLQDLLKELRVFHVHGTKLVIAQTTREKYIDGLAALTRKLLEIESADAAFTVVRMRDRIHVVGRSDNRAVDVRLVVREFGGDGHPGAGSAIVRKGNVEATCERVEGILRSEVRPQKLAEEIMRSPVRTVLPTVSMDEAGRIMTRHGLDGLIVALDDRAVGVVSRRDIDQATHHKLGHAPVQGFMSKPVISIAPKTPLTQIQQRMVERDIGRLPVIDAEGRILGVVSRHEVLKTLYGANAGTLFGWRSPVNWHGERNISNFGAQLNSTSEPVVHLSKKVGETAASLNMVAYAVGGFVRDLILDIPNFDLDYVIEGDAIRLAQRMQEQHHNELTVVATYERFQTATLEYQAQGTRMVDFSTARTEFYEYPAALPTVEPSSLDQDLMRRDFTINALAICLNPDRYGELIDEFGGLEDIRKKVIRVLHPFSFIEDPTRIIRAVRFAARLNFKLDGETCEQAKHAISIGIFDNLGGVRIRDELRLILESPHRLRGLELLSGLGAKLGYLDSELEYNHATARAIRRAERLLERYKLKDEWLVYLGLLLSSLPEPRVGAVFERLHMKNDEKEIISKGLSVRFELPQIFEELSRSEHALKNSEIYRLLHGKQDESLAIVACLANPGSPVRRMIRVYLDKLEKTKVELNGNDLVSMGFTQGPQIGEALEALLNARLDGEIKSREEELQFVRQHYSTHVRVS